MTAQLIDGKATAAVIHEEIKAEVERLKAEHGIVPGLATVLVGENPASQFYVRSKQKRCAEVGIRSFGHNLPENATQEEVEGLVAELNANPEVHGILVQLPLPKHLNEERVLGAIGLEKDVDGFHPVNIGRLAMKGREPMFAPCTPIGCIELLDRYGVEIEGKEAVVLGRSNIVGMPVAMLLLKRNATITICHSRTKDLPAVCRRADILIAAVGRPRMVQADWVKAGAAVIDVGINRVEDPTAKRGYRIVGDVDFEAVKEVAGYLTPVPGGVGPMTIAMLLRNTLTAAKRAAGLVD
ncbi:MAG: bifunctional methylenetetrahydrofolate dehydrogenase/methenyltetrahydrofolate cyclohydrolase FolD [Chloroflexi bacterium]|nr:MAG: bifunctional methylenetetrahydrofolate dehydrogenase/methenyltetrahydrofolate cyclohydrolase FolD [Chloroflexota bacterium]RLC88108.1 MAG: bifunctional methylenetetrahydrofolate dehydrogenase/methenyltetrahydrofolate cyclohydrolase FolD [Chloroflexota bacterium]HEY68200.1 bifunctional methylenetetrahydrofolate dehydrogenase/methenyltetrahydrofolate cyclohydrolase FolD [Thermoflexia bacterium]